MTHGTVESGRERQTSKDWWLMDNGEWRMERGTPPPFGGSPLRSEGASRTGKTEERSCVNVACLRKPTTETHAPYGVHGVTEKK